MPAGGRTPFALLMDYGDGDEQSGVLFMQYAKAFKGRRQLVWSTDLRARLGLSQEATDAELGADEVSELDIILARLSLAEWKAIYYTDHRGTLLDIASSGSAAAIDDWLCSIGVRGRAMPLAATSNHPELALAPGANLPHIESIQQGLTDLVLPLDMRKDVSYP